MRGGEAIAVTLIFVGIPWVLGWIFRTYLNHVQFMKVLQLRAENNARLLDRFGSDAAFLDYLKSDAQQKMFEVRTPEPRMLAPYLRYAIPELHDAGNTISFTPTSGQCVMFPGWQYHAVAPYIGKAPRISVAFNLDPILPK